MNENPPFGLIFPSYGKNKTAYCDTIKSMNTMNAFTLNRIRKSSNNLDGYSNPNQGWGFVLAQLSV